MNEQVNISVIIVDDQVLFAESLAEVISNRCDLIDVMGIANNGEEAIMLVEKYNPQVVIMDIKMHVMDGVEATRLIHERWPYIKIMVLTTFDDDKYVYEALNFGASGYILKNLPPEEIINCIKALAGGASQLSHTIAEKLIHSKAEDYNETSVPPEWFVDLKISDREILKLLCNGDSIKEIAAKVYLAEQTVKNYLSNLYNLMNVTGRNQAVKMILNNNIDKYF